MGSPPLRRMSRGALAHLAGEKDLACSLLRGLAFNASPPIQSGEYFAHSVMVREAKRHPLGGVIYRQERGILQHSQ